MGRQPFGYPSAGGGNYPGRPSGYPQSYPSSGGFSSSTFGNRGSGFSGAGFPVHSNYPKPKKTKSQKVKQAVKIAIAGYVLHKVSVRIQLQI